MIPFAAYLNLVNHAIRGMGLLTSVASFSVFELQTYFRSASSPNNSYSSLQSAEPAQSNQSRLIVVISLIVVNTGTAVTNYSYCTTLYTSMPVQAK